ncbi:MAG: SpoIIE family protein phosphatase [Planctomycetes bacterium]|nr:SpoIIE family protein phosphatase [Planctomycetota bacterium]
MLRELIDTTTLEEFVAGLALESGLSIRIYDDDGLHLFSTMPTSEFGRLTAGSRSHLSPAAISDLTADLPDIDVRPARIDGLTRLVASIVVAGEAIGFVAVGEFGGSPLSAAQVRRLQSRHDVDAVRIREYWSELRRVDPADDARDQRTTWWLARTLSGWCRRESTYRTSRDELSLISGIADLLISDQPLQAVLDQIVVETARVMKCHFCSIRLYAPETGELTIAAGHNLSAEYLGRGTVLRDENPIDSAALDGEVVYVEDARRDPRVRFPAEARRQRIVSGLSAGMIYRGRPVGVLRIYTRRLRRFRRFERDLLRAVASQAASAILHRKLLHERVRDAQTQRQLELAGELQSRMIGRAPPPIDGLRMAMVYEPSFQVGGDLCDFFTLADGRHAIVVADVVGKGVPASLLVASVRAALRATAVFCADLGELMTRLNRQVYADTTSSEFVTVMLAAVDRDRRTLRFCSAGHDPLMHMRGGKVRSVGRGGLVLGIEEDETYREESLTLAPGDFVLFYTDGLIEAMNFDGALFGRKRLRQALLTYADQPPERLLRNMLWDVRRFVGLAPQSDDITMVGLRVGGV